MSDGQDIKGDILVVDDTPANLRLLAQLLTSNGYKARPVPNGPMALRATQLRPPDLILLDINMPDMDGYEVCRQLVADEKTSAIPIIFISALDEAFDKVKAFQAGGVDYVTKPFQIEEVLARIENHMNIRRLQTALAHANADLKTANDELEQRVEERTVELQNQMQLFRKFVPETFTRSLGQGEMDARKGLAREEIYTVFSCDIRNFTDFSESVTCADCYAFLNSYFTVMEPGIRQFGGFVYQYVGDEIMALFEPDEGKYADRAVRAAVAIQTQILVDYNVGRKKGGYEPVRIGVGLNTGPVAIGVAGTDQRMDACAFGNTVNLAARCESLTKDLNANIIITEFTYQSLEKPGDFEIKSLGSPDIRGLREKIELFEVVGLAE